MVSNGLMVRKPMGDSRANGLSSSRPGAKTQARGEGRPVVINYDLQTSFIMLNYDATIFLPKSYRHSSACNHRQLIATVALFAGESTAGRFL
jgi:hypothetical protein